MAESSAISNSYLRVPTNLYVRKDPHEVQNRGFANRRPPARISIGFVKGGSEDSPDLKGDCDSAKQAAY